MQIYLDRFPEGRKKALTLSYDDGAFQDRRLVDIYNRYGIKGTFHLNSGKLDKKDYLCSAEVEQLYRMHEVSVHSCTHPLLAEVPRERLVFEIMEDRKALEKLVGYPVRGMSYPYASYNNAVVQMLPGLGIEYARIVVSDQSFSVPADFLRWSPTCHHNNEQLMELADRFVSQKASKSMMLFNLWGHSFEFDQKNNWEVIDRFCSFMGGRDDIWYATNIEIVDYVNALRSLRFSASCEYVYNPSALELWFSAGDSIIRIGCGETLRVY